MSTLTPGRAPVEAARNAVYAVFAVNGFAFASWASRIPEVRDALSLTPGQLGLTLLWMSAGSIVALPLAGRVAHLLGTARACAAALGVIVAGLVVIALGADLIGHRLVLAAGLFVFGVGFGLCDVAMNLEGATVERELGRSIMPRFHAAFSGGTVLAALAGAAMAATGTPVAAHLVVTALLVAGVAVRAPAAYLPRRVEDAALDATSATPAAASSRSAWTEPRTLLIGVVTLVAALTEGTANDWISVAFVDGYDLPAWAGVLAFATFLGFMTLGRLAGTGLLDRYGRVAVLRGTFAIGIVGSLMVVFGSTGLAYAGAALWGFGAAMGFPVGMSAAADDPARAHARVSVVATIGYVAFIAGPPLLGFLGDHYGVLRALLLVAALLVPALLAVPAVREPGRPRRR